MSRSLLGKAGQGALCSLENLETRRLLSGISVIGNRLTVDGSADGDVIIVTGLAPPSGFNSSFSIYSNGSLDQFSTNKIIKQIVINGGGGDDMLMLGPGVTVATTLNGDSGNDTLIGGGGADKFNGGDGVDTADYSARTQNLRLSLNGVADDGAFGEGDNIMEDVENILGGTGNDVIVGSSPLVHGDVEVVGLDGDGKTVQDNFLSGGPGNDDIRGLGGSDLIFGGEGNDSLDGGDGDDTLAGNTGSDYVLGGEGDDVMEINDGEVDTAIGGLGYDTAWADSTTVVDNVNAEDVFLI